MDISSLLQTCLAPNVSAEARHAAHQHLEQFKQRPDVLELSLELFTTESQQQPQPREFVLHFALRTCVSLVRMFYPMFPPQKKALLKDHIVRMIDTAPLSQSRLVESTAIALVIEVLKQDEKHTALFDLLISRLKTQSCYLVSRMLCEFSEALFEDDDDLVTSSRRTVLTKYMNSQFGPTVLPIALLQVEYELSVLNNEQNMAQSLRLCSECLRWNPPIPSPSIELNALALFERCCENANFPSAVIQASFLAIKHYCWNSKANVKLVYDLVSKHICTRAAAQYHNQAEFQLANDVFITLVQRHHSALPKAWQHNLENMTTQATSSPTVLNDYLEVWKDLIAKKPAAAQLSYSWILALVRLCLLPDAASDDVDDGDDDDDAAGEPFESQKPLLMKELVKQHGESMLTICTEALSTPPGVSPQQQWFLVENVSNGMTEQQLGMVKDNKTKFAQLSERMLDWVFRQKPSSLAELKVLHASHAMFETRTAFLSKALQYYVDCAVDSALPSQVKKRAACHLLFALRRKACKDLFILPSLVQRVSQVFPTLVGAERFVLLECILVAGSALPTEQERVELTRQVLAEPFQTLNETGPEVLQTSFIQVNESVPAQTAHKPWDQRGYFVDIDYLPINAKRFITSLMTISTCAKDGQLRMEMWSQLLPIAVACLNTLNSLWTSNTTAAAAALLTIHPVDAKMLFGSRVAETMEQFMDNLVAFGENQLELKRMAVITLLSSVRTCSLELIREVAQKFPQLLTGPVVRQLFQSCDVIEHRHLAMLLNSVMLVPQQATAERAFLHQVCLHIAEQRLKSTNAAWQVRVPAACIEFAEEANLAARRMLESSFTKFLAALPVEAHADMQFQWLLERIVFTGDAAVVRAAVASIMEKYVAKMSEAILAKLALPACAQAFASHANDGATRILINEVFADTVCRLAFRTPVKDFHLRTKPGGGKKKQQQNGPWPQTLHASCFPLALVNKFMNEVNLTATSEKTFKQCTMDLLKATTMPAAEAAAAVEAATKKSTKSKKKKKKGPAAPAERNELVQTETPPWHNAADSRDLGMHALFGDVDDDL